eukprot:gene17596-17800_t
MVVPLRKSFSTMCAASWPYSSGSPIRRGLGTIGPQCACACSSVMREE